jgi:hypothetical protein
MMARGPQRSSTLIDPAALQRRPTLPRTTSFEPKTSPTLTRHNSVNAKPLLNFDDDDKVPRSKLSPASLSNNRSVFGVDTLWEREMVKLREIEAHEKLEAEERRKREEAEENKRSKKRKKQKHKANTAEEMHPPLSMETEKPRVSAEPPMLPDIQRAVRRPPPVPDDESESDESEDAGPSRILAAEARSWHAGSSDEDVGPRRTTGTGPRYPDAHRRRPSEPVDVNSDDDLPLSVAVNRAAQRATLPRTADSDDEEKPLSTLLQKKQYNLPAVNFDNLLPSNRGQDDDDDNQPLGLRVSRFGAHDPGGDDDERPLAYHPEQQRRTQYQMMAQHQQQQQQLMLQAQMQSNMFFSTPTMMGPQFFGPPMMPMMMQPPMQAPSLPPVNDEAKYGYGRVDKWRHDVAVEGDA